MDGYCLISSAVSKAMTRGVQNTLRSKFCTAQAAQFFLTDVCSDWAETRGFRLSCGYWEQVEKVLFVFHWNPQLSRASHPRPVQLSGPAMTQTTNKLLAPLSLLNRVKCSGQGLPCSPAAPLQSRNAILNPASPMHSMAISKKDGSISKRNFPCQQLLPFQMHSAQSTCIYLKGLGDC